MIRLHVGSTEYLTISVLFSEIDFTILSQAVASLRDVRLFAGSASQASSRGSSTLDNVVYTSLMHGHPPGCAKWGKPRKGSSVECAAGASCRKMAVC